MLVLTRKVGEAISIGDDIKVIVMKVSGQQVKLGIKASPATVVHREEVYQKIHEENIQASQARVQDIEKIAKFAAKDVPSPNLVVRESRKIDDED